MQNDLTKQNPPTQKLPYSAPMVVDYGSVRELARDFAVMAALAPVAAAVV